MLPTEDVNGQPLAPESVHMMDYLKTRAAALTTAMIRERIRAAARELEVVAAEVSAADARSRPVAGKWNIAEVVDHISQTQIRGAEELRHLLAGRRPPLPPVYEGIRSGAAQWLPWPMMLKELHAANEAMLELMDSAPEGPVPDGAPTVKTVMVTLRVLPDGSEGPQIYFAELGWKEYALLQRLHLLDHRTQIRKLRENCGAVSA
jgi:hypothetical protein